ncbi:hypothetical protein NC651_033685 [Populus alba x Populus x berolinensis]|nr:hypothetical protein NC651_033685 [Populus alba x Populus x berolinensis]
MPTSSLTKLSQKPIRHRPSLSPEKKSSFKTTIKKPNNTKQTRFMNQELARKILDGWEEGSPQPKCDKRTVALLLEELLEFIDGEVQSEELPPRGGIECVSHNREEESADSNITQKNEFERIGFCFLCIPNEMVTGIQQIVVYFVQMQLSQDELPMAILPSNLIQNTPAGDLLDLVGDWCFRNCTRPSTASQGTLLMLSIVDCPLLKSDKTASNTQSRMPSYGTQVTIQTESEKQIDKLRRKEEKRNRRGTEHGVESDVSVASFSSLLQASEEGKTHLTILLGRDQGPHSLSVTALPQGTVRKHYKGYEEVIIPPTPTTEMKPGEKLIEIKELDDFAQAAFHGYKSLNRIQSWIFQTVYYTNENYTFSIYLQVCAPTGAGKTNIAMISVLHEIGQHFKDGYLHKDDFKIVYVAPMKALAAEVTSTFSHRLSPLNMTVRELTGDMQLSKSELEETQMIVTTPEKWDVITRKSSDMSLSMLVKLLIIDEVHLLNDDRGPVIEALVARTLRQVESTQTMIRIVGLSATLPNYLEVAQFLRVSPETGLFFFDSSYRPVPLAQQYIGISEQNFAARNDLLNEICYKKVVDSLKQGHQAMVFVHSRKDTAKTAEKLMYSCGESVLGLYIVWSDSHKKEAGL